jgi:hypothetical protein
VNSTAVEVVVVDVCVVEAVKSTTEVVDVDRGTSVVVVVEVVPDVGGLVVGKLDMLSIGIVRSYDVVECVTR